MQCKGNAFIISCKKYGLFFLFFQKKMSKKLSCRKKTPMTTLLNYIDGQLINPLNGLFIDNYEPATGAVFSQIPDSQKEDVLLAVQAAQKAFPIWANTSAAKRSEVLLKIAELIEQNLEALAMAESQDNGKPLSLAQNMDIPRAAANMRFFATAILHQEDQAHLTDQLINYTARKPIGVVGCISPWNLPLYLFTWKIAPALAAGCTVVAKPSEVTPLTAFLFAKICIQAGLPSGVLNIVHGTGPNVGAAIVEHPKVLAISFTGGTQTGKHIASVAAPMFKKLSLELGGKNPTIVFEDADFEQAVSTAVRAAFTNQGQICLCGSRIFVQKSIFESFKNAFVAQTKALVVGDPLEPATKIGALVSKAHMEKVQSYIQLAIEEGGTLLAGGEQVKLTGRCAEGYFLSPTVFEGLSAYCRTNTEEIFGPVVTLTPFEDEQEALAFANASPYGLAASLWTNDIKRAHRVAEHIDAGIVWINCWLMRDLRTLFGGMKQSGVGREGGFEALHFFTEAKNIAVLR